MKLLSLSIAILVALFPPLSQGAGKPNIVVILSDDMGFSDLGCYGGEIQTPNLDALAANGVRFSQFYNMARCCPTRASLLTGLYPHQAGMGHMTDDKKIPGYTGGLNKNCLTLAEQLKPAGYSTYMCGKWHVSLKISAAESRDVWPLQRGFEKFYGTITGAGSFYDPTTLCRGNTFITPQNDADYKPVAYYYTDAITDNAVKFLGDHVSTHRDQPFFLYVAYTAAHWPMHALPEDMAKYKGRYDSGYASVRAARLAKAKQLGLVDANCELSPAVGNWDAVKDKAWEAACMEVYAAMVDRMDQGIGKIVAELKRSGSFDNTLILFLQDNGGCAETIGRTSNAEAIANSKPAPLKPDDLQPAIWPPMQTRGGRAVRTGPGVMPGPADTYISYGEAWANVSNTPFREYKHWVHEGGISTPLIAHWPAAMSSMKGKVVHTPAHLIDVAATCADLSGAAYPTERNGTQITPLQGVSLRPLLTGGEITRKDPIFWEHEGNRAVRDGPWKLVAKGPKGPWELYDISKDRIEKYDLAKERPEKAAQMASQWDAWARSANVLPWPWDKGSPAAKIEFSKNKRFELGPDEKMDGPKRPEIAKKAFTVTVDVEQAAQNGVLAAQGGSNHGWALAFKDGVLQFITNHAGKVSIVSAPDAAFAQGARTIRASLSADGTVAITSEGVPSTTGKVLGPLLANPVEGMQVGRDAGNAVGEYKAPFPFTGKIRHVTLELQP